MNEMIGISQDHNGNRVDTNALTRSITISTSDFCDPQFSIAIIDSQKPSQTFLLDQHLDCINSLGD